MISLGFKLGHTGLPLQGVMIDAGKTVDGAGSNSQAKNEACRYYRGSSSLLCALWLHADHRNLSGQ